MHSISRANVPMLKRVAPAAEGNFPPPMTDFALIGHQESFQAAADVLNVLRGPTHAPIPVDELPHLLPWIPARPVCHIDHRSTLGTSAHGLYIDSFIPPDRLDPAHLHDNLARVRDAASSAIRAGARIVSLGGFSSILIEGNFAHLPPHPHTVFTTGNTLTCAFIVQGIQQMADLAAIDLAQATFLIIGATGDVGSGCARALAPRVRRTLLHARNPHRLRILQHELAPHNASIAFHLEPAAAEADIVLCAASLASASLHLHQLPPHAILCDAGYPKNLASTATHANIFFGGLGQITGGLSFTPDVHGVLNRHPFPDVVHGCLLEGMVLALERRYEPFSQGRGSITPQGIAEISRIAARHGVVLAPLYNASGPLSRPSSQLHQLAAATT